MSEVRALSVPLDSIASCFEGVIPASVCSCSREGLPNVTFLSIVHRLDENHVGLSFQFFNKTRKNTQENARAQVIVVRPGTADQYRLDVRYLRTETDGPAFDRMRARLEAVASQTGMSRVFRLRGMDVYEVLDCRPVNQEGRSEIVPKAESMREVEAFTERLASCESLDALLSTALEALADLFGHRHSFVMFPDEEGIRLYTGASYGFEPSGVGSEVVVGEGMLGLSAARRSVVRVTNLALERVVARAVRSGIERRGEESTLEKEIALPGLPDARSQIVLPLLLRNKLLGVLCLQSAEPGRFLETDERVMQIAARDLAASMANAIAEDSAEPKVARLQSTAAAPAASHAVVKHYRSDDSIFIDDAYLTKGIPGRLFWKLLKAFVGTGRAAFTNKEIRLDASLGLPDIKDNLETRLILLRRRLDERCEFMKLIPAGRGRLHLEVRRRLTLEELPWAEPGSSYPTARGSVIPFRRHEKCGDHRFRLEVHNALRRGVLVLHPFRDRLGLAARQSRAGLGHAASAFHVPAGLWRGPESPPRPRLAMSCTVERHANERRSSRSCVGHKRPGESSQLPR